jgi:hypothetical protein
MQVFLKRKIQVYFANAPRHIQSGRGPAKGGERQDQRAVPAAHWAKSEHAPQGQASDFAQLVII